MRKAAAYTREAVLELAAQRFNVARSALTIRDGVIAGGGKSARYGEIVAGQDLRLTIPVTGSLTGFGGLWWRAIHRSRRLPITPSSARRWSTPSCAPRFRARPYGWAT
jgi:hypothetical protein